MKVSLIRSASLDATGTLSQARDARSAHTSSLGKLPQEVYPQKEGGSEWRLSVPGNLVLIGSY